jgi:hypothetical protein
MVLIFVMIFQLCACSPSTSDLKMDETSTPVAAVRVSPTVSLPKPAITPTALKQTYLHKSKLASLPPHFIPIDSVGTYDTSIITDELLHKDSPLPEASSSSLPYWTGFIVGNKAWLNDADDGWPATDGNGYFYEEQFKWISENGFNCARILYSFSFLSDPKNWQMVDESQLKQLDEVISWGMKYNLHIMLSITGLPGKEDTKTQETEDVRTNDEFFTSPKMAETVRQYFVMIARRYAAVPNKNFSIELFAEPATPDNSLDTYTKGLTPVVQSIRNVSPDRILIVNDLSSQIPEQLAALGCSLSLHTHIATINSQRLPALGYKGHWPMEYLPSVFDPEYGDVLILQSENGFNIGTLTIYFPDFAGNHGGLLISADGKTILKGKSGSDTAISAEIPQGTKEIKVSSTGDDVEIAGFGVIQKDRKRVVVPTNVLFHENHNHEPMPTIRINEDGTTTNMDHPQVVIDDAFFSKNYLQPWMDVAQKYHVGFVLSEVGTDTEDLTEAEFMAYETEWLKALKENQVPWMWNYLDYVCGVKMRLANQYILPGETNLVRIPDTPLFYNKDLLEMIRQYR